jgi:ABC-type uncharacterized transport system involved in gliding motility auxiliary subunit
MTRRDPRLVLAGAAVAVLALVVGANLLAARSPQAVDLTRSGQFTLTAQSIQATRQLDSDLVVTGYFRPDQLAVRRDVETLLDLYRQQSPHVQVRFADPEQAGGAGAPGSIVLQYRNRSPVVLDAGRQSEPDVTATIERLESGRTPVVCWAAGDGERGLQDADVVSGYSAAANLLRTSGYQTQTVELGEQTAPATCDVLVVLELSGPLSAGAAQAVQAYLARGGTLLLAVDPWLDGAIVSSVNALLQPYGAAFDGGLVIEPDPAHAAANDSTVPVVSSFGESPITTDLLGRHAFFPAATPIVGTPAAGTASVDLAASTAGAFSIPRQRTDLSRRAGDEAGPFVLMRSIEQRQSRIVLAGTSALAENWTMPPAAASANAALLLASLDWLTRQDSLLGIPPKPPLAAALPLTGGALDSNVLVALPLPPLAVLAAALLVLVPRRRRPT